MKKKIFATALALCGCVMMVFAAAKVDPCTEKHAKCGDSCTNEQARCKAGGSDPDKCERAYAICMQKCDKEKKDCESKSKKS